MKKGTLLTIITLAALAHSGFASERGRTKQDSQKTMSIEEFVNRYTQGLYADKKLFDQFFSDNYFNRNPDPFRQMDSIRGMMGEMIKNYDLDFFERSFNDWYNARFGTGDMNIATENKDDKTILTIQIPGLNAGNVDVNVSDKRIKISGSFNRYTETTNKKTGVVSKSQEYKSFLKILPVPAKVNAALAQTKVEKETITITFPRSEKK